MGQIEKSKRWTRRSLFSSVSSLAAAASAKASASTGDNLKFLNRNFFQRLAGQCATPEPKDSGCWNYSGNQVSVEIVRAPELAVPGGAIRLEGKGLEKRVLVVRCEDGQFRAWPNACTHAGRRLDPVPGTQTVQCCSVNKSTFHHDGRKLYGPAKGPIQPFGVKSEGGKLVIVVA